MRYNLKGKMPFRPFLKSIFKYSVMPISSMADPKVVSYIKRQRGSGFTDDSIRQALTSSGYNQTVIAQAFKETGTPGMASSPSGDGLEVPVSLKVQTAFIPFNPKASRIEVIVRMIWYFLILLIGMLYAVVAYIIVALYSIPTMILYLISNIVSFILGKRIRAGFNWAQKFMNMYAKWYIRILNYFLRRTPYMMLMIDQRPKLGMDPEPEFERGGSIA